MQKLTGISLLLILFISSCASLKQFRYMNKGKAPKGSFRTEIPFEFQNELIVIRVKLNDSDKEYEFMVDSGAPVSVIYKDAFEASKADTVMTYDVFDSRGNSTKSVYLTLDITIGNSRFKDIFTAYTPETSEIMQCIAKDGIIGADLMQTANWEIDFEHQKIVITDFKSSHPDLEGYRKVSFSKRSPSSSMPWLKVVPGLTVDMKIKETQFKDVYVDLGSNGSLTVPKNEVTDKLFKNELKEVLWGYSSYGLLGGSMDTTHFYKDLTIEMSDLSITKQPIDVYKRNSSLLGTGILSNYHLFIDFRKKNMYLKPNPEVLKKTDENSFGFRFDYHSKTKVFSVTSLYEGSPAALAGLQLNDTIVEINNQKIPEFTDYCEFKEWKRTLVKGEGSILIKTIRKEEVMRIEKGVIPRR